MNKRAQAAIVWACETEGEIGRGVSPILKHLNFPIGKSEITSRSSRRSQARAA